MPPLTDLETARRILGADVLGPDEIRSAFGVSVSAAPIPYSIAELDAADGEALILRIAGDQEGPLTLLRLIERFPDAFDPRFLSQMGYLLKDEWGIQLEPLASRETCAAGWALVGKQVLQATCNLPYEAQDLALARYAGARHLAPLALRRRTAVEIAYDLMLYQRARGERLLAHAWDWSASPTIDNGYLNVGGFGPEGMQILSYSPAVRHGALGVCPVRQPRGGV